MRAARACQFRQMRDVPAPLAAFIAALAGGEDGAIETGLGQLRDVLHGGGARVDPDGARGARCSKKREVPAQHIHHFHDLLGFQKPERPTGEMDLLHLPVAIKQGGEHRDFPVNPGEIGRAAGLWFRRGTQIGVRRKMYVQRQRARDRITVGDCRNLAQILLLKPGGEGQLTRITGMAGTGAVESGQIVTLQELCSHQRGKERGGDGVGGSHKARSCSVRYSK